MSEKLLIVSGDQIVIRFIFQSYQGEAPTQFDLEVMIGLYFQPEKYTITHTNQVILSHDYSTLILSEEAEQLSSQILEATFEVLKRNSGTKE